MSWNRERRLRNAERLAGSTGDGCYACRRLHLVIKWPKPLGDDDEKPGPTSCKVCGRDLTPNPDRRWVIHWGEGDNIEGYWADRDGNRLHNLPRPETLADLARVQMGQA